MCEKDIASRHVKEKDLVLANVCSLKHLSFQCLRENGKDKFVGENGNFLMEVQFYNQNITGSDLSEIKISEGNNIKEIARVSLLIKKQHEIISKESSSATVGENFCFCWRLGKNGVWYQQSAKAENEDKMRDTSSWKLNDGPKKTEEQNIINYFFEKLGPLEPYIPNFFPRSNWVIAREN